MTGRKQFGMLLVALAALTLSFSAEETTKATPKAAKAEGLARPSVLSLSLEASGLGGFTVMDQRPTLSRSGATIGGLIALGDAHWTWFALGIDGFIVNPSMPDPSLFLYRGYGGKSIFIEGGGRFGLRGAGWKFLKKGRVDISAGPGLAATEDTGTTLVSIVPFIRLDTRLFLPLGKEWAWSIGLPMELQKHATALTFLAGLSASISLASGFGK